MLMFTTKADRKQTVMNWPPQTLDLNIIEAVWDHLDKERNKREPKSKEKLRCAERSLVQFQDGLPKKSSRRAERTKLCFSFCVHMSFIFWSFLNKERNKCGWLLKLLLVS